MKLQIVNDLHNNWEYKDQGADLLLIAGDFGNGIAEIVRLMKTIKDIPVYFVLGNHDYYGEITQGVVPLLKAIIEVYAPNWHLLDNEVAFYNDVRIIGTTLWTDCGGIDNQWFVKQAIKRWPDFAYTKWQEGDTTRNKCVEDLYPQFREAEKFLKRAIADAVEGKTVVMTHFVPVRDKATHPRFGKDVANYYFTNDLEYLMGKDMLWHFGHTHDQYDFMVGDTRLVCNPVGYGKETTGYAGDLIIEI
jgi:predicted phosphohydrolase